MTCLLSYEIELALEGVARKLATSRDEQLLDRGRSSTRGLTEIGLVGFDGYFAPADQLLSRVGAALLDDPLARRAFIRVGR